MHIISPLSLLACPKDVNAYFSDHDTPLLEQPGQLLLDEYMPNL